MSPTPGPDQTDPLWSVRARHVLGLLGILVVYVLLRALAWSQTVYFEDHDNVGYLRTARAFQSLDLGRIAALDPDATPFYPLVAVLFSVPGWSLETGARLATVAASVVVLLAAVAIVRRFGTPLAALVTALLLCFHPVLVPLSKSILTEMTYIAVVYTALWLFWTQYSRPTPVKGALLGLICALAFLTRLEGLLLLGAVPLWQFAHFLFVRPRTYPVQRLAGWVVAFAGVFVLVSAPQVWRVSHHMGEFALNGRQAWSVLLTASPQNPLSGASYEQAIYGLDFSPGETNLNYVKRRPEARQELSGGGDPVAYLKVAARNFDAIYRDEIDVFFGPLALVFFGAGALSLYRRGRRFDVFVMLSFFPVGMAAPLFQSNLLARHLVVLLPMIAIGAGIGVVAVARALAQSHGRARAPIWLPAALATLVIAAWALPLRDAILDPPASRYMRDRAALDQAVEVIRAATGENREDRLSVASRMAYVPLFTDARWVPLPYSDMEALIRYLRLNEVDYLVLEYEALQGRPYEERFLSEAAPGAFQRLCRVGGERGPAVDVYRFGPTADSPRPTTIPCPG